MSSGVPVATTRRRLHRLRTQVDHPVGGLDDLEVVLDHHDGVALVAQAVQDVQQLLDVVEMQPGGGLVQM